MANAKIIFIDGTDRVGKGSLMQAIHKATNYKHLIFDRSVLSNKVYSEAHNRLRAELIDDYNNIEQQLANTDHIVLYLYCDIDVLEKRKLETQHEDVDFKYHQELFSKYMKHSPLNIYPIDTTVMTPSKIAEMLIDSNII